EPAAVEAPPRSVRRRHLPARGPPPVDHSSLACKPAAAFPAKLSVVPDGNRGRGAWRQLVQTSPGEPAHRRRGGVRVGTSPTRPHPPPALPERACADRHRLNGAWLALQGIGGPGPAAASAARPV